MSGCFNRPPLGQSREVQDGRSGDVPYGPMRVVTVSHAMTTDCQYTHSEAVRVDPGCQGCRWRAP